ncbi:MAG: NAD-dependent epimerase/dehydratase family protein [archaeon]
MDTYLVTGCAGFIGFNFIKKMLIEGKNIIGIDNLNNYYNPKLKKKRLNILKRYKKFIFKKIDIADYNKLYNFINQKNINVIVHLAAQAGVRYSLQNPWAYESSNNLGTLNVFECARNCNIKKVVFASSASVYGDLNSSWCEYKKTAPISLYAATKLYNENLAYAYNHLYNIDFVGLRFFSAYGEYGRPDMALWIFAKNILEDKPIDVYNFGNMKRDFSYIDDIVSGISEAIKYNKSSFEIFNLSSGGSITLKKYIQLIEKHIGKNAKINYLPLQAGDILKSEANLQKSNKLLRYYPKTNIDVGVNKFIKWYLENWNWIKDL